MDLVLLDSSVFLEVLLHDEKEKQASEIINSIACGKIAGVTSALCVTEVKQQVLKRFGSAKGDDAVYFVTGLPNSQTVDVTPEIASAAADLRFKYYDGKRRKMSLADAVQIATAIKTGCNKIITRDSDYQNLEEIAAESY